MTLSAGERRLASGLERLGALWLIALPLLRPLIWSGDYTTLENQAYLTLLAAAIATGLMHNAVTNVAPRWSNRCALGAAFLLLAAWGCWRSELPARAWALWSAWTLHIAAPLALMNMIRRRPAFALAGLVSGCLLEIVAMGGQYLWERPALAETFSADPRAVDPRLRDQYAVRIGSWRLEGTFLLANTLAAYLNLVIPIVLGCAVMAWRGRRESTVPWMLALIAALGALAWSGSKAGILSLLVSCAITAVIVAPARLRWIATAACVMCIVAALAVPAVRSAAAASAGVRIDYWRAGAQLIRERPWLGYGLESYKTEFTRVKPPAAEETIVAHNEVVQAAADLGIPTALVLLAWWFALLRWLKPRRGEGALATSDGGPTAGYIVATCAFLAFTFGVLGVWHDHFGTWPGGAYAGIGILAMAAASLWLCRSMPAVPRWAYFIGALACLLHALADFHLHSPQVVGVLAWVTALGSCDPARATVARPMRQGGRVLTAVGGLAVVFAVMAGVMFSTQRQELHDRAERADAAIAFFRRELDQELNATQQQEMLERFAGALKENGIIASVTDQRLLAWTLARGLIAELTENAFRFPADSRMAWLAVSLIKHSSAIAPEHMTESTDALLAYRRRWPGQMGYAKALADHYHAMAVRHESERDEQSAAECWQNAERWATEMVRLYPTHLPFREELLEYARKNGDQPTVDREREALRRLAPLVHPNNAPRGAW